MSVRNKQSRTYKFTKTKLQQILYPENNEEIFYHDTESSCFKLKVTKNQKTFYYIRKINNKTKKIKLGVFSRKFDNSPDEDGYLTVDNARDDNNDLKERIKSGKYFNIEDIVNKINDEKKEDESFTVNDAMAVFYELFKIKIKDGQRKSDSLTKIKQNYKNHIKNHIGNKQFISVTRKEISDVLFNIKKVSASVYNKCLSLIKSLYNSIISHKELNIKNPVNPKLEKVPDTERTRFLQPDKIQKFFEADIDQTCLQ